MFYVVVLLNHHLVSRLSEYPLTYVHHKNIEPNQPLNTFALDFERTIKLVNQPEVVRRESFPEREESFVLDNFHDDVDGALVLRLAVNHLHVLNSSRKKNENYSNSPF